MEGRSRKTFTTYNCAFRKLWVHSVEIGKSVFNWNEMDVAGHLIMLDGNEVSVIMIGIGFYFSMQGIFILCSHMEIGCLDFYSSKCLGMDHDVDESFGPI